MDENNMGNNNSIAVSYTHLDVYKRQVHPPLFCSLSSCGRIEGCQHPAPAHIHQTPVLSHESSFLLLKRHLSQVYCHGRGKSFKKKLCVSWALSLVECVAVWALKLPVPHTDAFKTHSSQSFFLNY